MNQHFLSFFKGHMRKNNSFQISKKNNKKLIIFIHGLCADTVLFKQIASSLNNLGYDFGYYNYNSKKYSLNTLSNELSHKINTIVQDYTQIVVIGHSMGGIISLLTKKINSKIDKVICISTPLNGSKSARFITRTMPKKITGISVYDLKYKLDTLPDPDLIIYSELNNFNRNILSNQPGDGIIFTNEMIPDNKNIKCIKILNEGHTKILWNNQTIQMIKKYILSLA